MLRAVLAAIALALPVSWEDRDAADKQEHLREIAAAVAKATRTADEAAFVLAWGFHESAFSIRIHEGRCRLEKGECDAVRGPNGKLYARARGPWQTHRNGMPGSRWAKMIGREHVETQAEEAVKRARWALRTCGNVRGAFVVLGGRRCSETIKGLDERVRTFQRVKARMR